MEYLILNLNDATKTNINYKIDNFPDGQRSVIILNPRNLFQKVKILVVKSICNFADLELVCSTISALKTLTNNFAFYAPYLIGARSDRKFETGGDFYFRDVIEPILKSLDCPIFSRNLHCESKVVISLSDMNLYLSDLVDVDNDCIVYPDESAYSRLHRIYDTTNHCIFRKTRESGKITQDILNSDSLENLKKAKDVFIVDDLFDGGGSFVDLIDKIKNENNDAKITIYVTHFIGSDIKNLEKLKKMNVRIITTNSYDFDKTLMSTFNIVYFDLYTNSKLNPIFSSF